MIYTYDILGRRTKATFDGQTTVYIYNGDNIQTEYKATGTGPLTTKKHYINGILQDALIAYDVQAPSGSGYTSTMMYYYTDILGSVVAISTSESWKAILMIFLKSKERGFFRLGFISHGGHRS